MEPQDAIKTFRRDFQAALTVLEGICDGDLELPQVVEMGGLLSDVQNKAKKILEKLKPKLRKYAVDALEEDEPSVTLQGTDVSRVVVRIPKTRYALAKGVTLADVETKLGDRAKVFFERKVFVRGDIEERMKELATPEELAIIVKLIAQTDPTPRVSFQSKGK